MSEDGQSFPQESRPSLRVEGYFLEAATMATTDPRPMSDEEKKVIFASSLGTVFEWYDFYLYGSLAAIIAKQFFSGFWIAPSYSLDGRQKTLIAHSGIALISQCLRVTNPKQTKTLICPKPGKEEGTPKRSVDRTALDLQRLYRS